MAYWDAHTCKVCVAGEGVKMVFKILYIIKLHITRSTVKMPEFSLINNTK